MNKNAKKSAIEKRILGLIDTGGKKFRSRALRVNYADQPVVAGTNLLRTRSRFKTKDLIGLLLGHGARARRASLPRTRSRIRVFTSAGDLAVQIRFH